MEQDENYDIGMNGEITSVQFGLYASEDITAADGKVIPKDGLIETVTCDENGKAVFATDLPVGAKVYVKEIATDSHYILDHSTYPVTFEYAGQDTAVVKISVNNDEAITNEIIRGSIIGKKLRTASPSAVRSSVSSVRTKPSSPRKPPLPPVSPMRSVSSPSRMYPSADGSSARSRQLLHSC